MNSAFSDTELWLKFGGILLLIAGLILVIWRLLLRQQEKWLLKPSRFAQLASEVATLDTGVVIEEAKSLLADETKFRCTPAKEPLPAPIRERLGAELQNIFEKNSKVECLFDELRLEVQEAPEKEIASRYIGIGYIAEHAMLLAMPGSDAIYEWDTDSPLALHEQLESLAVPDYASPYHCIVTVHRFWLDRQSRRGNG